MVDFNQLLYALNQLRMSAGDILTVIQDDESRAEELDKELEKLEEDIQRAWQLLRDSEYLSS